MCRRFQAAAAISAGFLIIAFFVASPQPRDQQFQGKTVDAWLAYLERQRSAEIEKFLLTSKISRATTVMWEMPLPERKVIEAFGRQAIAPLERAATARPRFRSVRVLTRFQAYADLLNRAEQRARRRSEIARRWLKEILNPTLPDRILTPPPVQSDSNGLIG